jgi:hypothetical protein
MLPFEETYEDGVYTRTFSQDTDSGELMWHRDREDRTVYTVTETDWLFQMDDELPRKIDSRIFIPAGKYHRIIKGTGDLVVKLIKHDETHLHI